MATRSRRELSKNKKRKLKALSKIVQSREGGENLLSDDDEDDGDIYDVVTEEQYRELVNQRRKGEEFVVDDDGTGYYDDGEEHLFDVAEGDDHKYSREASTKDPKARQRMRKQQKKASLNAEAAKDTHRLGAMFLGMSGHSASPNKKKQRKSMDDAEELDLDAELDSLNASDAIMATAIPRRQNKALQPPPRQFIQNMSYAQPKSLLKTNATHVSNVVKDENFGDDEDNSNMEVDNSLVDIDEEADDHAASMVAANRPNTAAATDATSETTSRSSGNNNDNNSNNDEVLPSIVKKEPVKIVEENSDLKKMKDRRKALFLAQRQKAAAKSAAKSMDAIFKEETGNEEDSSLNTKAKGGWFDVAGNTSTNASSSQDSVSSSTFTTAKDMPTLEGKDEDGDTPIYGEISICDYLSQQRNSQVMGQDLNYDNYVHKLHMV